ncbi:MAG: fumarylacetoacetase [Rhizorhabdus sp.]
MPAIDHSHDPKLTSWVPGADGHRDFPIQNLPYGIFSIDGDTPRPAVAIGDKLLDLAAISGLLPVEVTGQTLNALFALAPERRIALRHKLSELLSAENHRPALNPHLHDIADVTMHLPMAIGDYTDFYAGIHHAKNVGKQFRPDNPLLPNYKYVPIGYHGRASSIRPSGVPLVRPSGQRKPPKADIPVFGPTQRLDYELELGIWIGRGNELGEPIPISEAAHHIAGFCLLNDWSARELQAWEYQPLGPFLAKNFHSTVSPWVITAEAMAPFRIAQPPRGNGDPQPLPYLWDEADQMAGALALDLEVSLITAQMRDAGDTPHRLSHGPAANMYWTVAQLVTHHTSNGCDLRPGDLLGTGTISAPTEEGFGSLLELSRGGAQPIALPNGEERGFVADGDEVILTAHACAEGYVSIGFGECRARVLPAR